MNQQLKDYVDKASRLSFSYGSHDCASFCANYHMLHYGKDFLSKYRGKYKSEYGISKLMKKEGYPTLIAALKDCLVQHKYQIVDTPIIGDICVFYVCRGDYGLGLMTGEDGAVSVGDQGVIFIQKSEIDEVYSCHHH